MDQLDPIPQEFFDENRERFDGVTDTFDVEKFKEKCVHQFERISYSQIHCKKCLIGLIDNSSFILQDGKIVGKK